MSSSADRSDTVGAVGAVLGRARVPAVLKASGLCVEFQGVKALDEVSLEVYAGSSVAVTGSSGSGKSTLLHCLAGLRGVEQGSVVFEGVDIAGLDDRGRSALRLSAMGVVFQFGELVPELTVLENVALPAWLGGESQREAVGAARELLEAFSILEVADRHPGRVSGGERQRAAVARALVHRPRVVFADEPTGSLDSDNADRVVDALLNETTDRGIALVLVTHESRLARRADRVVSMRDGRVEGWGGRL